MAPPSHMLRDTFAVEILLAGAPIEKSVQSAWQLRPEQKAAVSWCSHPFERPPRALRSRIITYGYRAAHQRRNQS